MLAAAARELGLYGAFNEPRTVSERLAVEKPSHCVVLARSSGRLEGLMSQGWRRFGAGDALPDVAAWTDERINILSTLRLSR